MNELTLPVVIAILVGAVLKRKVKSDSLRKLVPVLNFAVQVLGRLVLEVAPANASVLGGVVHALKGPLSDILWQSLISTVLATGVHSTAKNALQSFGVNSLALAKAALIEKLGGVPKVQ